MKRTVLTASDRSNQNTLSLNGRFLFRNFLIQNRTPHFYAWLDGESNPVTLHTDRLLLRNWKESDFEPFSTMCANPEVMRYFPATLERDESITLARRLKALIEKNGWGVWAVEVPDKHPFIGFVGLHVPEDNLPCSPCTEIAWRLDKPYWHHGYASEAAAATIEFAFSELELTEIVAFTATLNHPSIKVMERIGMRDTGRDFAHPEVPPASKLSQHVLYSISRPDASTG